MPKCYNCGAEIEEGKMYCDNCNDSVENESYLDDLLNEIVGRENAEAETEEDVNPFADMFSSVEGTVWDESNNDKNIFDIEPIEEHEAMPTPEEVVVTEDGEIKEPDEDFLASIFAEVESTFDAVDEDLKHDEIEEPVKSDADAFAIEDFLGEIGKESDEEANVENIVEETIEETVEPVVEEPAVEASPFSIDDLFGGSDEPAAEAIPEAVEEPVKEPVVEAKKEVKPVKEKKVKKPKEKKVKEPKPKKEKTEKKPFLEALGDIFFESDEEAIASKESTATKEQEAFMLTMAEGSEDEAQASKKGKKDKNSKKDKKNKKGKNANPNAEEDSDGEDNNAKGKKKKKAKKPKAKKEKVKEVELEPDELVRITPIKAVLFVVSVASVVLFVVVWTYAFGYYNNIKDARKYYDNGNYTKAYETLSGMKLREDEQRLYTELRMLMGVQKNLNSYYNFKSMEKELEALDALFKGVKNYQENVENSKKLDIYDEYTKLYEKNLKILKEDYGISEENAIYYSSIEMPEQYMQILKNYGGNKK